MATKTSVKQLSTKIERYERALQEIAGFTFSQKTPSVVLQNGRLWHFMNSDTRRAMRSG
jgi:hypothetical protein